MVCTFKNIMGISDNDPKIYRVLPILRNLLDTRNRFARYFIFIFSNYFKRINLETKYLKKNLGEM